MSMERKYKKEREEPKMRIFYALIRSDTNTGQMAQIRGLAKDWKEAGEKALEHVKGEIDNPRLCELRDEGEVAF